MRDEETSIRAVSERSEACPSEQQPVDYRAHRDRYAKWRLTFGREPERVEGYAETTARNHAVRMDRSYRWVWTEEGG